MGKLRDGTSLSAARSQAARREVIRPFVCSTFQDFHRERDFLQECIFPQLNTLCNTRGISFLPVDLRWNKSQSHHNSEHVLRMCLDSIGRCAPFFICLLGNRYGVHRAAENEVKDPATEEWLNRNFETASACGYDWVLEEENRYQRAHSVGNIFCETSKNQRLRKCVRWVLLLYNWYLRVFLADHRLQTWS